MECLKSERPKKTGKTILFEDLVRRGNQLVEMESVDLRGRLGVGFAKTWGTEKEITPEGVVGLSLGWRIREGQVFEIDTTLFPDLGDLSTYRLMSNAAYRISIGQLEGLSLKFGAKSELNHPSPGKDHALKYYGSLVYDF